MRLSTLCGLHHDTEQEVLEIIFLSGAKHIGWHFLRFFEGVLTFLTPKLPIAMLRTSKGSKRSRPTRKTLRNARLYVLPEKKNNIPDFQNQQYINSYYVPLAYILHVIHADFPNVSVC